MHGKQPELQSLWAKVNSGKYLNLQEELFLGTLLKKARSENATDEDKKTAKVASNLLAKANQKLVFKIANKMYWDFPRGVTKEDYIGSGMLGMARALQDYEPDKGFKFSTYATRWIIHYIQRHGGDISKVAKFPSSKIDKLIAVNHKMSKHKINGTKITPSIMRSILESENLTEAEYNKMLAFNSMALSLEGPAYKSDDGAIMADIIESDDDTVSTFGKQGDLNPSEIVDRTNLTNSITKAMASLNDNEKRIMGIMYGPGKITEKGEEKITLTKARQLMGMTKRDFAKTLESAKSKMREALMQEGFENKKI